MRAVSFSRGNFMSLFNDAINTGKRILVDRLIPEYNPDAKSSKASDAASKSTLWNTNILNEQLVDAYRGNGIGRKLVNKIAADTFDNWFTIESENETLIEDVSKVFSSKKKWITEGETRALGLKKILKETYKVGMVEGYALLMLGYSDEAGLEEEIENPKSLDYLSIITRTNVRKLLIEKDSNSEHYGEIVGAMVKLGTGPAIEVHASRFIYMPVNQYGNDPEGIGYMRPAYNYLVVLDNVIWSTGQAFYRNAAGFIHYIKKKGKPAAMKAIKAQAAETNSKTAWVSDETTEIKDVGVRKSALNPEQYWNVALKAVAMSFDIPMQIVEGVAAGAVTGSETNLKDYYSDISAKQELDFTPVIEQLITILQGTKQVADGDYKVEWNPLQEMNAKEQAEIDKLTAETESIRITSGVWNPEEIKKELEQEAKTDAKVDALFPDWEYSEETNLVASEVIQLGEDYAQDLKALFSINEIMKVIKASEVEGILTDDFGDLERELELIEKARAKKIKDVVDKNVNASWQYGWERSELLLNLNIIASEKAGQIKKILRQSNYVFVNSYGTDVTKRTLFAVQESMLAGEGIPQMRKKIQLIVDGAKHNADTLARTESHRAMTQAIKQSYRDSGKVKRVKYLSAGDTAVRPTHAFLNGHIFDLNNTPPELEDPNCRCTIVAYFGGS